jgi:hypothetical protein
VRLTILRQVPLALLALLLLTLAYQYSGPQGIGVAVGGGYDAPYVRGFHEREEGAPGRWATDAARVLLPGVGARDATLIITAGARPDGVATPVRVVVNGLALGTFTPAAAPDEHRFALPTADYSYGDLTVDLRSDPQLVPGTGRAPVPFGPRVLGVRVEPVPGAGLARPPVRPLAAWAVLAPLCALLLRRLGLRPPVAFNLATALLLVGAAATAVQRLDLTVFAPRLALLVALLYPLVVALDRVVPRLFAVGGVALDALAWPILRGITVAALFLKLASVLYPQLVVIDQPAQAQFFAQVLHGHFLALYRPTPGGLSALPGQWGVNAQLPYPPFLFALALPAYLGPFGTDLSINVWSVLLDGTRPLLVAFLAARLGVGARAATIAAFAMAFTGSTFLLHSWGNYPTTASQWCALLFLVLLVARFRDLRRPRVFVSLLALLTVTMLLYTVTAAFVGVLLLALLAGLAWRGGPAERRQLAPLAGLLAGAATLAFLAYYAQYVGPLLSETLPAFRGKLGQGEALGIAPAPFPTYAWRYGDRLFRYGLLTSLLLALPGTVLLLRGAHDRLTGPLLAAWYAVFALGFLAGTRVDMVDKEMWFILPALAIGAGVACDALVRRARAGGLGTAAVALYLAHLAWLGTTLWLARILVVRH